MEAPLIVPNHVILVEASTAKSGGSLTYLQNLMGIAEHLDDLCFILLVPAEVSSLFSESNRLSVIAVPDMGCGLLTRLAWLRWKMPSLIREIKPTTVFFPGGTITVKVPNDLQVVVACRNMLPLIKKERQRYPLGYMRFRLWLLEKVQMRSYRQATDVIFVSKFARKFLQERIPRIEEKSRVIYHGISSHFFNETPSSLPTLRLTPKEYILYVSVFDYYKAQLEVVREWASYKKNTGRKLCLVLVGGNQGSYFRKVVRAIEEEGLGDDVRLFRELAHTDLPWLYQNALVNLFASSCENCPNILLEMMASGRPLLCSDYGPMREIAGEVPTYFDPYEKGSLASALTNVVPKQLTKSEESQVNIELAQRFSTNEMVKNTVEVLTQGARGVSRCVE